MNGMVVLKKKGFLKSEILSEISLRREMVILPVGVGWDTPLHKPYRYVRP